MPRLIKVPFDLDHWHQGRPGEIPERLAQALLATTRRNGFSTVILVEESSGQSSVVQQDKTENCTLKTDNSVLQVAVARLLGYRWPAELDSDMELSDAARAWVKKSEALLPYADKDGIVCLPPVDREKAAADRLLNLLAAAYGQAWSNGMLAQLLARQAMPARPWKAGCARRSSTSIASCFSSAPSSGTSGTACATALPHW